MYKIYVLGHDYSAILNMVNSLNGYDLEVIKRIKKESFLKKIGKLLLLGKDIEYFPKNVLRIKYVYESLSGYEILNNILKDCLNFRGKIILIPTSDYMASVIDSNKNLLDDRFYIPRVTDKSEMVIELMNKSIQKNYAKKAGLKVINEYNIENNKGEYIIPNNIHFPVFMKPKVSFLGVKSIMKKCNNLKELIDSLNDVYKKINCPILVEDYVEIKKEYAVLGCSYNGEIIVPGIIEKIETAKGKCNGVTLKGKTTDFTNYGDLKEKIINFIKLIKFEGLFDIELYEDNGIIYFNELNLRFGAEGYGVTLSGCNLPDLYVKKILDIEYSMPQIQEKVFLSNKANLDSYEFNNISWKEYLYNEKNVDNCFIKGKNKKINLSFFRLELYTKIKKNIKKVLHK